ncbi:MAG: cytochrome c maturation protein CcmE [Methylococcales bacterium]
MNPTRIRRIWLIVLLLVAAAIAGSLITFAMQENMTYLFTPTQVKNKEAPDNAVFRLGGVVCEGSVKRTEGSLAVSFSVTDRVNQVIVEHEGILPDMFKEGTSIIATGKMQGVRFTASEVLAKHDETYTPKEMQDAMKKAKEQKTKSCGKI